MSTVASILDKSARSRPPEFVSIHDHETKFLYYSSINSLFDVNKN